MADRTRRLVFTTATLAALLFAGCTCEDGIGSRRDAGRAASMDARTEDTGAAPGDAASDGAAMFDALAPLDDANSTTDSATDVGPAFDASMADAAMTDAAARDAATHDAGTHDSGGCVPGTSRACAIDCGAGSSAPGRQVCLGADTWSMCDRVPETCMNAIDDDADGSVDEGCREEGGCLWIRASCQGLGTLNQVCARSGRPRLVEGRRCPVAGGSTVPLDMVYGEYQLACCDVASTCRPECTSDVCASSVVWDEIRCCP